MKRLTILASLLVLGMTAHAQLVDNVAVSATVGAGSGNSLTIAPDTIAFGTVNPSPTDHRFQSNILTADFFAATAPWFIEVSTDNAGDKIGLVSDAGNTLPLKFNTANLGAGDPENDYFWSNATGAVWRIVLDNDDGSLNLLPLASSSSLDSSPTEFSFAIDAASAVRTNYGATVRFELKFE